LNSKFHFLSTTIRTFYDPRSTHLFIGVQYFSVVSVLQSHVLFTENSVIVITDHHNSSDLHRTNRTTLQRAPFNSMSYICVNTVKIESCVCAATARSLVDYNSCAVGTSQNKNASHAGLQAIRHRIVESAYHNFGRVDFFFKLSCNTLSTDFVHCTF
jgi:hypothetical protein